MLQPEATGLADLAQQDPTAAAEMLSGFDAEAMEQMVLNSSGPEDRAWNLPFDRIRVPASVLFGAKDLTHSPDHGEVLASRIPGARRTVFEDAGGALLWTHARSVLEAALDR